MYKKLLLAFAILPAFATAQNDFKSGFIINLDGSKTKCLIKDADWKNNPTTFEYKLSIDQEKQFGSLKTVQEFAIPGTFRYVNADVDIDRSGVKSNSASDQKAPIFKKEKLFLKVLVDGKYKLFHYFENGLERFFYSDSLGSVKQLVYKYYHPPLSGQSGNSNLVQLDRSRAARNYQYRNQLWNDVKCEKTQLSDVDKLDYATADLIAYFQSVNACGGAVVPEMTYATEKKGIIKLSPSVGFASYQMEIADLSGSDSYFPLGVELEYVLPYNNYRLSIFLEPNYNKISMSKPDTNPMALDTSAEAEYSFIEIPAGVRYSFSSSKKSTLFISGIFAIDVAISSSFDVPSVGQGEIGSTYFKFGAGIGYRYHDFAIEARAFTTHGLVYLVNTDVESSISKLGVTLRYNLL